MEYRPPLPLYISRMACGTLAQGIWMPSVEPMQPGKLMASYNVKVKVISSSVDGGRINSP